LGKKVDLQRKLALHSLRSLTTPRGSSVAGAIDRFAFAVLIRGRAVGPGNPVVRILR